MKAIERRRSGGAFFALAAGFVAAVMVVGCGTPGAPLPPSLGLPALVTSLTAVRTGDEVALAWTMPKKNTDKLLIKGNIAVRVCRNESGAACQPLADTLFFAPDAKATFTDRLPAALASGQPRPLTYFVELLSPHGRTAGPSNTVHVLAGQAPGPVMGLSIQLSKAGATLHWVPGENAETAAGSIVVRLHRKLVTPKPGSPVANAPQQGFLAPPKECSQQT